MVPGELSWDGGETWSSGYNQPTAQFYHVCADDQQPYRIYGSQQDNWAISLPSQSHRGAITPIDGVQPGGGESGYIAPDPQDTDVFYAGSYGGLLTRINRRTGERPQPLPGMPLGGTSWHDRSR